MIYVIKHVDEEGPGLFGEVLPSMTITLRAGIDPWPQPSSADGIVLMGGPMGVYEADRHPWIPGELAFLRRCRDAGAALLGVCLGAQMIAEAFGGRVYKGAVKEIGWGPVVHSPAAASDPLFSVFPKELDVFQWHQDTFDLPDDAVVLASNGNYPNQAFRIGDCIYGLQYHIEVTEPILREWFTGDEADAMADGARLAAVRPLAIALGRRFLDFARL